MGENEYPQFQDDSNTTDSNVTTPATELPDRLPVGGDETLTDAKSTTDDAGDEN